MLDVFGYIDPSSSYLEPAICRIVATRLVYLGSAMERFNPRRCGHRNTSMICGNSLAVALALVAAHK